MKKITRRNMVAAIGTVGAGTCICGMNSGCSSFTKVGKTPAIPTGAYSIEERSLSIEFDKVPQLTKVGGAVKIIDQKLSDRLIVARTGEEEFAVVSLLCTHRGCEVEYFHENSEFRCASLGHSKFKVDGSKIKGFAKGALKKYLVSFDPAVKDRLVVTL